MASKLTAQILADLEQPYDLSISPDGRLVTYITKRTCRKTSEQPKSRVWVAEIGKEHSSKVITGEDYLVRNPQIRPDGRSVAYLSNQHHVERIDRALFLQSLESSQAEPLKLTSSTEHGSILSYRWSEDGKSIIFAAPFRSNKKFNDVIVYAENVEYNFLWQLNLSDGSVRQLTNDQSDITLFEWNPEGTEIVYCTRAEPDFNSRYLGQDIMVYNLETETSKLLVHFPNSVEHFCWSNDGILVRAFVEPMETSHGYSLFRITQGKFSRIAYGETNDLYGVKSCQRTTVSHVQDGMMDSVRTYADEILWQGQQQILEYDAHFDGERQTVVMITSATGVPPEIYSVLNGLMCQLSEHGYHIAALNLGKCHVVKYDQNGIPMDGYYCVPSSLQTQFDRKEPLKTIVVVKGGPSGRGTDNFEGLLCWSPYLLSLGYLLLYPNYRGGTSHGDAYARAVRGNPAICYEDVLWMTQKGIEEGWIDKNRVSIAGWSNGGFVTYLAVTRDSTFHFSAAIAGAGISDWYLDVCLTDMTRYMGELMGCDPWDQNAPTKEARKASAIANVREVKTPLLMLHGEKDPRVPVENALIFRRALSAVGKNNFEMAIYPGEGHQEDWTEAHFIDYLERMERFLRKYAP